jgi:hypothetical protein
MHGQRNIKMWIIKFTFLPIYDSKSLHSMGTGGVGGNGESPDHRSEFQMKYTQFPGTFFATCMYTPNVPNVPNVPHTDSLQVHI